MTKSIILIEMQGTISHLLACAEGLGPLGLLGDLQLRSQQYIQELTAGIENISALALIYLLVNDEGDTSYKMGEKSIRGNRASLRNKKNKKVLPIF